MRHNVHLQRNCKTIDNTLRYLHINCIIITHNGTNQLSDTLTLQLYQILFFETRILQKVLCYYVPEINRHNFYPVNMIMEPG
jgi:hypothetical protein